jgi:hypothetical protein
MKEVQQKNTLIINRNDSYCGNCSKGCDPMEKKHDTVLGYGVTGKKGCGEIYKFVKSDYSGLDIESDIKKMRPDLELIK